jgi:ribosomal protein S6
MKEKDERLDEISVYEIGFHILPNVPEEKLPEIVLKLKDSITSNDGEILTEEFPKMTILAYDIKKRVETKYVSFNKAFFGWVKFEALRSSLEKIEKETKANQNVLRFIIVKTVRENTLHTPKIPMMARSANVEEAKIPKSESAPAPKTEVSEAEIDKSIDELLVDEIKN